jgi:hypothetical protein
MIRFSVGEAEQDHSAVYRSFALKGDVDSYKVYARQSVQVEEDLTSSGLT